MNNRILVVEDHLPAQIVYTRTFEKRGYAVTLLEDGGEAMNYFMSASDLPDIMLIDVNLPHISGLDLVYHLRERMGRKDVILILISANIIAPDIPEAKLSDLIILKPVSPAKLIEQVEALIRRRVAMTA